MSAIDRYDLAVIGSGEAEIPGVDALKVRTPHCHWSSGAWWEDRVRTSRVSLARTSFTAQRSRRWLDAAQSSDSSSARSPTNMAGVQDRKRRMVDALIKVHLDRDEASGVELIMGHGRFVAPKTIGITLNGGGGTGHPPADRVILSLGTRASDPHRARSGRRVAHDPRAGARS